MVIGIDEAPSCVTMTGAIPVTKIVPARPITKAPHHPVSRLRLAEAYFSSCEAVVCLGSAMTSPFDARHIARVHFSAQITLSGKKVSRQSNMLPILPICRFVGQSL